MFLRVFVPLALLLATAVPAYANVMRPLATKVGVGELRGACSRAGGNFGVHPDGGGYGCEVKDCDGKGGTCIIACDNNNNCNGSTPTRISQPTTIIGILQNGKLVIYDAMTTGATGSLSEPAGSGPAGGAGNGPAAGAPAAPPVIIY